MKHKKNTCYATVAMALFSSCITPFSPKGIEVEQESIVIEGDIILNDNTKVFLSFVRTLNSDDITYIADATVWVEDTQEHRFTGSVVEDADTPPYYLIDTRMLSFTQQYKLCVMCSGKQYESDFLTPIPTPDIDTIGFTVNDTETALHFHVTTYGNDQISPYYKWNYTEDWEVVSAYPTNVFYLPRQGFTQYPTEYPMLYCWNHATSNPIIARTDHLRENTIYEQRLNTIHGGDDRISYLYSMELSQISISKEAYTYWSAAIKNTNEAGGIFAPQPSELYGNIRCISDPELRVLGYISAGTRAVKRIFATAQDMGIYAPPICLPVNLAIYPNYPGGSPNDIDIYRSGYRVVSQSIMDVYEERGARTIKWLPKSCVDCTERGTKNKPSFWPNDHQ